MRLVLLAAAVSAGACREGRGDESGGDEATRAPAVQEVGKDLSTPVAALGQLGELAKVGEQIAAKSEELKKRAPVDPVSFRELLPLLPEPEGWEAKEPTGQTSQMGQWKISTASRSYSKGKGKDRSTMKVEIVDGSYLPMVYAPFTVMSQFSRESTTGHTKGLKIDGQPAVEEWKQRGGKAKVLVLVDDRFLLTVSGSNTTTEAVRDWIGQVGVSKLAALAAQGG